MGYEKQICTIGGGTGMPVVNRALIKAGFINIKSIVTTFDSGGDTGRLRTDERGKILAYSDYWRSIMSLWQDGVQKELWEEMLRYRDGRNRNFGNTFFQFMTEKVGGLDKVCEYFAKLMDADLKGEVIPVSMSPAEVCFKTKSGRSYCGEHRMDELRMSSDVVKEVWLNTEVEANEKAVEAVKNSEVIIICPGSMYGSVITNFLPKGMVDSYQESKAKKLLITNIMSVANENDSFDQNDYVKVFEKYLGKDCFDLVVMSDLKQLEEVKLKEALKSYKLERSSPIKYFPAGKTKTMLADIASIEASNYRLRHNEDKLAALFSRLLLNIVGKNSLFNLEILEANKQD